MLLPLLNFFYDKTHIIEAEHYLKFIIPEVKKCISRRPNSEIGIYLLFIYLFIYLLNFFK